MLEKEGRERELRRRGGTGEKKKSEGMNGLLFLLRRNSGEDTLPKDSGFKYWITCVNKQTWQYHSKAGLKMDTQNKIIEHLNLVNWRHIKCPLLRATWNLWKGKFGEKGRIHTHRKKYWEKMNSFDPHHLKEEKTLCGKHDFGQWLMNQIIHAMIVIFERQSGEEKTEESEVN